MGLCAPRRETRKTLYAANLIRRFLYAKNNNENLVNSHRSITFAVDSITNHYATMETTIIRHPACLQIADLIVYPLTRHVLAAKRRHFSVILQIVPPLCELFS